MSTDENAFKRVTWNDEHDPSDDDGPDGMPLRAPSDAISPEDMDLLTLAARTIGAVQVEPIDGEQWVNLHMADGSMVYAWNPLTHGDDAFNLMVDLELDVMPSGAWVGSESNELAALVQNGYGIEEVEAHAGDPKAATRRAITRTAAEIAKQNS